MALHMRPVGLRGPARLTGARSHPRVVVARDANNKADLQTAEPVAQPGSTATSSSDGASASTSSSTSSMASGQKRTPKRQAESTDAIATFLTRRFGLAGGLAWLGFLAIGSLGEQVKTRWEVASEEQNIREVDASAQKEVVLPNGLRYTDLRVGGGQMPTKGYLMVVNYIGRANGEVFEDTYARGKPIVFFFGGRPFSGGMCQGVEQALAGMKAGGKRRVVVPAELGFGSSGAVLRPTEHVPDKQGIVPADAELEYELELVRVSIPPS